MTVTLDDAKAQLNLTTTDDDALVTRLILAAQSWLEAQLGYVIATQYPDAVPPALDQAVLLMVAHWYANREASLIGVTGSELPLGLTDIVQDYRNWSWGECSDA